MKSILVMFNFAYVPFSALGLNIFFQINLSDVLAVFLLVYNRVTTARSEAEFLAPGNSRCFRLLLLDLERGIQYWVRLQLRPPGSLPQLRRDNMKKSLQKK